MKLKIMMTMTGLMVASTSYAMFKGQTAHNQASALTKVSSTTNSPLHTNASGKPKQGSNSMTPEEIQAQREQSIKDYPEMAEAYKKDDLKKLQNKQRSQLSPMMKKISELSKDTLGFKERGILVSGKLSLYDQTLADLRQDQIDNPNLHKGDGGQGGVLVRSVAGNQIYNFKLNSNAVKSPRFQAPLNTATMSVNAITNTITWKDAHGNILKQMSKNLNGTTTVTEFTYLNGKVNKQIQTTYASDNLEGARSVRTTTPKTSTREATDSVVNFNETNKFTSGRNNLTGEVIIYQNPASGIPAYKNQFYAEQITGKTGGIVKYANALRDFSNKKFTDAIPSDSTILTPEPMNNANAPTNQTPSMFSRVSSAFLTGQGSSSEVGSKGKPLVTDFEEYGSL